MKGLHNFNNPNEYLRVFNELENSGKFSNEQLVVLRKAVDLKVPPEGIADPTATSKELEERLREVLEETELGF